MPRRAVVGREFHADPRVLELVNASGKLDIPNPVEQGGGVGPKGPGVATGVTGLP